MSQKLGRGIEHLFGDSNVNQLLEDIQQGKQGTVELSVDSIRPNPYQPRKVFDPEALKELSQSIASHGVFTPILVKRSISGYELVTGERRLRASKLAGKSTIPAIVVEFDDQQMMEIALLENIQREDLNVIEEAKAYEQLLQKLNYTQEQLAKRVGKSREHITNILRLLRLPDDLQAHVTNKELSMGHVRALLGLSDVAKMRKIAKMAIDQNLSVRKVEQLVKKESQPIEVKPAPSAYMLEAKRLLEEKFQTSVQVKEHSISIHYENEDDLNRVLELLNLTKH